MKKIVQNNKNNNVKNKNKEGKNSFTTLKGISLREETEM